MFSIFLGRSGLIGSHGNSAFNILRMLNFFKVAVPLPIPTSSARGFRLSTFSPALFIVFLIIVTLADVVLCCFPHQTINEAMLVDTNTDELLFKHSHLYLKVCSPQKW